MKIGLVNKFYPPIIGGIEYHIRTLAEMLEKYAEVEKIEILVANSIYKTEKEKISEKIYITRVSNLKTVASTPIAPALIRELRHLDVDIVHFHFPYPFGDFSWLCSFCEKPYIITYHSDILRQKYLNYLYAPIRNKFFSKAKRVLATSPNICQESSVLQRFANKISIVPLGISPGKYFDEKNIIQGALIKKRFKRPIVLFVGRFVYYKGVDILIKASRNLDIDLIMIGKGPLLEDLQQMVLMYGIADKVHFYSNVNDDELVAYFLACDMFVLPSIANTEAYGLVQLEAHAAGKPVISTNLPTGVPFVNKHMETGLIVEPKDILGLKNAMKLLAEDSGLRQILGENAQKRMLKEFTDVKMVQRVYDIYFDILKK
jgi:Glycosyltransferase